MQMAIMEIELGLSIPISVLIFITYTTCPSNLECKKKEFMFLYLFYMNSILSKIRKNLRRLAKLTYKPCQ